MPLTRQFPLDLADVALQTRRRTDEFISKHLYNSAALCSAWQAKGPLPCVRFVSLQRANSSRFGQPTHRFAPDETAEPPLAAAVYHRLRKKWKSYF
jgi:hypothetical protein